REAVSRHQAGAKNLLTGSVLDPLDDGSVLLAGFVSGEQHGVTVRADCSSARKRQRGSQGSSGDLPSGVHVRDVVDQQESVPADLHLKALVHEALEVRTKTY